MIGRKTELPLENRAPYVIVQNSSMHEKTVKALLTFLHSHSQLEISLTGQTRTKKWVHESLALHLKPQTLSLPYRERKGRILRTPPSLIRTLESIQANRLHLKSSRKHNHWMQSGADPLLTYRIRLYSLYKQCISKHNKKTESTLWPAVHVYASVWPPEQAG